LKVPDQVIIAVANAPAGDAPRICHRLALSFAQCIDITDLYQHFNQYFRFFGAAQRSALTLSPACRQVCVGPYGNCGSTRCEQIYEVSPYTGRIVPVYGQKAEAQ